MTEKQFAALVAVLKAVRHVTQPEVMAALDAVLEEDAARKAADNMAEVK